MDTTAAREHGQDPNENLITLRAMVTELGKFDLPTPPESHKVRRILDRLEIAAVSTGTDMESNRGRVHYYEKLVTFVVATFLHLGKPMASKFTQSFRKEVTPYREPKAGNREGERVLYYMYITHPRFGIGTEKLERIIAKHPELLELTSDHPSVLTEALRVYKAQTLENLLGKEVELASVVFPNPTPTPGPSDRHLPALIAVMRAAGLMESMSATAEGALRRARTSW